MLLLVVGVPADAIATTAQETPTPEVSADMVSNPKTATGVTAPVVDLTTPVLDIVLGTESIDGSIGVAQGGSTTTVTVSADVLFAFDKAALTPAARAKLAETVQEMRSGRASGSVVIGGHADSKGSTAYNRRLSERRAQAVKTALEPQLKGLSVTLQAKGFGDTKPVAKNTKPDGSDNPAGRKKNRRVTIAFTPER